MHVEFTFKSVNKKLYDQMREKFCKELEKFEERRKVGINKNRVGCQNSMLVTFYGTV